MKNIISIRDLSKTDILKILNRAEKMQEVLQKKNAEEIYPDKILGALFFEPSTRTKLSFKAAMKRLGGRVIGISDVKKSSVAKGESFGDTIKVIAKYVDIVAMRHPLEGSARYASELVDIPIINGGDGANQHPTQTLLDLYAIKKFEGGIEEKEIALIGDLRHARTMRSLAYALSKFGAKIKLVSPKSLKMSREVVKEIKEKYSPEFEEITDLKKGIKGSDAIYVCRIQEERFKDPYEAKKLQETYQISLDLLEKYGKSDLSVLHPLPKLNEIGPKVDGSDYAKYYEQASFGIPVRMAIIDLLLGGRK